ncbi:MAG: hypothetical protein WC626_06160 [Methanoregula sp.]
MENPPNNKNRTLMIVGIIILIAIICIVIAVIASGAFAPQKKIPSPNITPPSPINPSTGASGTLVRVTMEGKNFSYGPSPSVWLAKTGEPDITATDVVVILPTQLACTFPLPGSYSSAGPWDVFVKNAGEQSVSKIGVFTIVNAISSPLTWDWSVNGWKEWQYSASCKGTTGTAAGYCVEYGPVMVDGHGEYGSNVTLDRVPTESSVSKTFTAPSGTRWNTLTFNGLLSSSRVPPARWMAIDVNGIRVFYADASKTPPGNGQKFTITQSFTPANSVNIRISSGQDPTYGTPLYIMQFNSLTLS